MPYFLSNPFLSQKGQGIYMPYDPSCYGRYWGHLLFAYVGGGGCQNRFYGRRLCRFLWLVIWRLQGSLEIHPGRKLLPTDSLLFQINSMKTYRYRYRSVIISNYLLLLIPIPIPLQGSVAPKSPICNSSELTMENLPMPIPICNVFELVR